MGKIEKITFHWDAGRVIPTIAAINDEGMKYHFLINGVGNIIKGKFTPEDNIVTGDSKYAAHCGGGNTGNIGICLCGMYGFVSSKKPGKELLTSVQCERAFKFAADLCKKYGIKVTPETVFTHYEFGQAHPNTTSFGKVDITYLPPYPKVKPADVGDFIREKVQWYLDNM